MSRAGHSVFDLAASRPGLQPLPDAALVEAFIRRWQGREGGQERANYGLFLMELCDVLGVERPQPADATPERNTYVFERTVEEVRRDGTVVRRRIDLYRRDCFILEAKQSRDSDGRKTAPGHPDLFVPETVLPFGQQGRQAARRAWDVLMLNARRQAEDYVRLLPADHKPPPFIIVCDVGHCLELYANFRRDGKAFDQFPNRQAFRIFLEDLRDDETRRLLQLIWDAPTALDPAAKAAKATREIAGRLAAVSRALEMQGHAPERVAMFLMRVLFTMFAEDFGLIPKASFSGLLEACQDSPAHFAALVEELWRVMDHGGFSVAIKAKVPRFNGEFFTNPFALPLEREALGELLAAARHDWRDVEPAIFGTLLEQALDPGERRRLGAHYTPRAYVERLVVATVIEPLREEWSQVLVTAERQKLEGRIKDAIRTVSAFHIRLCETRVLDPACGTGNFLYVALELMKRLEGEVLEALAGLGGQEALPSLERHTVDPHGFIGLEVNGRAAAIAELVLWIGYLQWHFRIHEGAPGEPILQTFNNIRHMDAVLDWEERPAHLAVAAVDGRRVDHGPRRPAWPEADYIVGNPPFIGGKDLRARLGSGKAEALWVAHPHMNESADFVMYWWDRAAELLARKGTKLKRFGFVTTNSITQAFSRRVIERHLTGKMPVSLVMAVPDHPWTRMSQDAAAVRIAMTVAEAGSRDGVLLEVVREAALDSEQPMLEFRERTGRINSDLTVGVDLAQAMPLKANQGLCSRGMSLHGAGFIVRRSEAEYLGLGRREGLEQHIRPYRNGRDLTGRSRDAMVIDLFGLEAQDVRGRFPELYQHLLTTVKPERDRNNRATYRDNWWVFGEPRRELRPALAGIGRYIATVETARHRVFQFLDAGIVPDNKLIVIPLNDAAVLGVLSSRIHIAWSLRAGGWLGAGNDPVYVKSRCFDVFPFPEMSPVLRQQVARAAEDLDSMRKARLAEHPELTLTGLYNVLEKVRAGVVLSETEKEIRDKGTVLILQEMHDALDQRVAQAYGWRERLADEDILGLLVTLNRKRAMEERTGRVSWLRPEYQVARFGSAAEKAAQVEADLVGGGAKTIARMGKSAFPSRDLEQTAAVMAALLNGRQDARSIAVSFRQGRRLERKVESILKALVRFGVAEEALLEARGHSAGI